MLRDVAATGISEFINEAEIAEDDAGHLGEELLAVGARDILLLLDETRDHLTCPSRHGVTVRKLRKEHFGLLKPRKVFVLSNTGKLEYDRLNGTREVCPSYT